MLVYLLVFILTLTGQSASGYRLSDTRKPCDCDHGSEADDGLPGDQPLPDFLLDPVFSKDPIDWFENSRKYPGGRDFPQAPQAPATGLLASLGNILTSLGAQPDDGRVPVEEFFTKEQYNPLQGRRFRDSGFDLGDFHGHVDIDGHVKPKLYQTININVYQQPKPECGGCARKPACEPEPEPAPQPTPEPEPICTSKVKADIVLLMDASTSVGPTDWKKQVEFAAGLTEAFSPDKDDVRFGAVIFNKKPSKIFDLNTFTDSQALSQALKDIKYPNNQGTNTHLGLSEILTQRMFSSEAGGRDDAPNLVIVITDGKSTHHSLTVKAATELKASGVQIIAVGVGKEPTKQELEDIASDKSFVFTVANYQLLDHIKTGLVTITCSATTAPPTQGPTTTTTEEPATTTEEPKTTTEEPTTTTEEPTTTTEEPTSTTEETTTTTEEPTTTTEEPTTTTTTTTTTKRTTPTRPPYPPSTPEPCKENTKADIVLLLDASTSIGWKNWKYQTQMAANITKYFDVGADKVRFATTIFNGIPTKQFDLKDYLDHESLSKALLAIAYPGIPGTKTYLALQDITNKSMFGSEAGGRDDAPDILIVMTDGKSDNINKTMVEAAKLKLTGMTIIAVGIGPDPSQEELKAIASAPENVFNAASYDLLAYIMQSLVRKTCDTAKSAAVPGQR